MSKRLSDFRKGALFLLLYHVTLIAYITLDTLLSPFYSNFNFECSGFQMNALAPLLLFVVFTPILYLLIRRFSNKTILVIMAIHLILTFFTFFRYDFGLSIYAFYIIVAYPSIIPLYHIFFIRRSAYVAWGALTIHIVITVFCYWLWESGLAHSISQWMIKLSGDDWDILYLFFEFIARTILPLIPIMIHLIIALFRWGFSFPDSKQTTA